jgi:hypothetical protein
MVATGQFVSDKDVRANFGEQLYNRLFPDAFDFEDQDPVQILIDDAEAEVFGAAVSTYPAESLPQTPEDAKLTKGGQLLRTITLIAIRSAAMRRFPEVVRGDYEKVSKRAEQLIEKLRSAKIVLHGIGVDPANVGGELYADDPNLCEPEKVWENTGIF